MSVWQAFLGTVALVALGGGAVVVNLVSGEIAEFCEWAAHRIVRWAAHCSTEDLELAETRAEEWADIVYSWPGKVTKLLVAIAFTGWATRGWVSTVPQRMRRRLNAQLRREAWTQPLMVLGSLVVAILAGLALEAVASGVSAGEFASAVLWVLTGTGSAWLMAAVPRNRR